MSIKSYKDGVQRCIAFDDINQAIATFNKESKKFKLIVPIEDKDHAIKVSYYLMCEKDVKVEITTYKIDPDDRSFSRFSAYIIENEHGEIFYSKNDMSTML